MRKILYFLKFRIFFDIIAVFCFRLLAVVNLFVVFLTIIGNATHATKSEHTTMHREHAKWLRKQIPKGVVVPRDWSNHIFIILNFRESNFVLHKRHFYTSGLSVVNWLQVTEAPPIFHKLRPLVDCRRLMCSQNSVSGMFRSNWLPPQGWRWQ